MTFIKSILTKVKSMSVLYAQVLFVVLAFGTMVFLSYFFMSGFVRDGLVKEAETALTFMQSSITSDLKEVETVLDVVSITIRGMIVRGEDFETVARYMELVTEYAEGTYDRNMTDFIGLFGMFDAYDGQVYTGSGWTGEEGYVAEERPWYYEAEGAGEETVFTDPYVVFETGEVAVSCLKNIFDDEGNRLAIIRVDLSLDRIARYILDTYFEKDGYGTLLNKDLDVMVHPDPDFFGVNMRDLDGGIGEFADDLENGVDISEQEFMNYNGELAILFTTKTEQGWYLGVVAPVDRYYQDVRYVGVSLIMLGLVLAAVLSAVLVRMTHAKNKADEYNKLIYESVPVPSALIDMDFNCIECNKATLTLLGLTHKREFLENLSKFHPKEQPCKTDSNVKALEHLQKVPVDGSPYRFDWVYQDKKGELIPCDVLVARVKYKKDFVIAQYMRDLREEIEMQAEIRKKEVAEESNKTKSRFIAQMSHEMRTPLNTILGITEIEMQYQNLSDEEARSWGMVYNSGHTLLNIINDILDLSKIEAGKLEISPVKYDIPSLINDTMHLNMMRLGSKPINFELRLKDGILIDLIGDELRIKQILNNLLSNAFKYTDEGSVRLSLNVETLVDDGADENDNDGVMLVLTVKDTGQGMTEEQLARLFDEYSRFNLDANRNTEGTGLGMSITRHLVEMMGGDICVESAPGEGTEFTVWLPQKKAGDGLLSRELADNLQNFKFNAISQGRKAQIVRFPMPYGKVLIVDDVDTNLYVAKGLMAPYQLYIETAASGFEAVEKIKSGKVFDIVFMDHMMPGMDGIETVRVLRELGYTAPIVALTANAVIGQSDMFLSSGFDGFISKPIDIRELNFTLNRMIRDKQTSEVLDAANKGVQADGAREIDDLNFDVSAELALIFINDAEKTLHALEAAHESGLYGKGDMKLFSEIFHGVKGALANIGDKGLSDFAAKLERAGANGDVRLIKDNTVVFIEKLKEVIIKIRPPEHTADIEDTREGSEPEDIEFLKGKLREIKSACESYDVMAVNEALAEFKAKARSPKMRGLADKISAHLLHSEFEEAAKAADVDL